MLDLRSEGPVMPLEALLCAVETERIRTGWQARDVEVVLSPDQMADVYAQMQSMVRFDASPESGPLRWNGMQLRQEAVA